jgi:hypothetical protein
VFDSAWFANKQFVFLGLWRKWALFRDVFDSVAFATRQFIPNCFSRAGFRRGGGAGDFPCNGKSLADSARLLD